MEKERVKDPRRVEQGKRLTAISREAKEHKAREQAQQEAEQQRLKEEAESGFFSLYTLVIPVVGIALGGYYLYNLYRPGGKEKKRKNWKKKTKKKPNLERL